MPETKPCPDCGDLAEKVTYQVPKPPDGRFLEDLDAWECACGWSEDYQP